jgi:hypothetical protein
MFIKIMGTPWVERPKPPPRGNSLKASIAGWNTIENRPVTVSESSNVEYRLALLPPVAADPNFSMAKTNAGANRRTTELRRYQMVKAIAMSIKAREVRDPLRMTA